MLAAISLYVACILIANLIQAIIVLPGMLLLRRPASLENFSGNLADTHCSVLFQIFQRSITFCDGECREKNWASAVKSPDSASRCALPSI